MNISFLRTMSKIVSKLQLVAILGFCIRFDAAAISESVIAATGYQIGKPAVEPNPMAEKIAQQQTSPLPAQSTSYAVMLQMPDLKENYTALLQVTYNDNSTGTSISKKSKLTPSANSVSWAFKKTQFFPEQPSHCGSIATYCAAGSPAFTGTAQILTITIGQDKPMALQHQHTINCSDLDSQGVTTIIVHNNTIQLLDHLKKPIKLTNSDNTRYQNPDTISTPVKKIRQPNLSKLKQKLQQTISTLATTSPLIRQHQQQREAQIYQQLIAQVESQIQAAAIIS